jgi:hypothetical protein
MKAVEQFAKLGPVAFLSFVVQQPPPSPGAQLSHPDGGLAQRRPRADCGHDGQRKSVAHMPTAPTTAADRFTCSVISGDRNGSSFPTKKAVPVVLPMGSTSISAEWRPVSGALRPDEYRDHEDEQPEQECRFFP